MFRFKLKRMLVHTIILLSCTLALPTVSLDSTRTAFYSSDSLRLEVAKTYTAQIGVRETLGNNDSHEIREYLSVAGFSYPVPWCAAFVAWTLTEHHIKNPKSAWSPSWFPRSKTIYTKGKGRTPRTADVFGIYYSRLKRIGHVGFIDKWTDASYCITVEGNTNSYGSREGDGVLRKRRLKEQIDKVSSWM